MIKFANNSHLQQYVQNKNEQNKIQNKNEHTETTSVGLDINNNENDKQWNS